jgi:hypothetical protein
MKIMHAISAHAAVPKRKTSPDNFRTCPLHRSRCPECGEATCERAGVNDAPQGSPVSEELGRMEGVGQAGGNPLTR